MSAAFQFTPRQRRVLARLLPVVVTAEADELGVVEEVVHGVEGFLNAAPAPVRTALQAGIASFDLSAAAWPGHLGRRFAELELDQARRHFERWWDSPLQPLHQVARVLKMFLAFSYYEHPRVQEGLGYRPEEWIEQVKREREQRFAAEIAAGEEALRRPSPLPLAGGASRG